MACTLPLKWLGLRRVTSAALGMLKHTPRAFFRQPKRRTIVAARGDQAASKVFGAGKSAVTDNIRCKRIANFRHGHDYALRPEPDIGGHKSTCAQAVILPIQALTQTVTMCVAAQPKAAPTARPASPSPIFAWAGRGRARACLRKASSRRIIAPQKIKLGERCHERVFTP